MELAREGSTAKQEPVRGQICNYRPCRLIRLLRKSPAPPLSTVEHAESGKKCVYMKYLANLCINPVLFK